MNRLEVIQTVADRVGARTYLEIGIKRGATFLRVRVSRKLAVDPEPFLARRAVVKACVRDPRNLFNRIARKTSDEFFAEPPPFLVNRRLDVAFIDGLHTYAQSLKDVENCLGFLNPGGIILLHDCNPGNAQAARPALQPPAETIGWSGDVWKTIVHLRFFRPNLRAFVLDCDCGIGVVSRGDSEDQSVPVVADTETLDRMGYEELALDRERLLGLRHPSYLQRFLDTLSAR